MSENGTTPAPVGFSLSRKGLFVGDDFVRRMSGFVQSMTGLARARAALIHAKAELVRAETRAARVAVRQTQADAMAAHEAAEDAICLSKSIAEQKADAPEGRLALVLADLIGNSSRDPLFDRDFRNMSSAHPWAAWY